MRFPSAFDRTDRGLDVSMTPMIDVVFMLLIFFVWTASFHAPELTLPSSLITQNQGQGSVAENSELEDLERVVIRMTWDGTHPNWAVNDVPVATFAEVRRRLEVVAGIQASLPVLVDPAPAVPLGYVIDVYDVARLAGFEKVQFATPSG